MRFSPRPLIIAFSLAISTLNAQSLAQQFRRLDISTLIPETSQTKSLLSGGNTKIDAGLRNLIGVSQAKSVNAMSASAKSLGIDMEEGLVAVSIATADGGESAITARIEELGGSVTTSVEGTLFARVPASAIESLGQMRQLQYLSAQATSRLDPMEADAGRGANGVIVSKANLLHEKGFTGRGIKVGVLDFGFAHYENLMAKGLVPKPVAIKAFHPNGVWNRGDGTPHGTACVEIIHAMAPDAQIYIASVGDGSGGATTDEIILAGKWLAAQGVDVISYSGGSQQGPHNGSDPLDKMVEEVTGKGVLWVNSAGNEGDSHWAGPSKINKDGLLTYDASGNPFILVKATGNAMTLLVTWDDWGANPSLPASTQDIDAYLLYMDPATGKPAVLTKSENPQNGRAMPVERINVSGVTPGTEFALVLRATRVTRPVRVHVHAMHSAALAPATPWGSIGIPATSSRALAVGAVHVDSLKLESYSSQGPTDDDRAKPEVSAPANMMSVAFGSRFAGTSAACPHVSGFAALLKQMEPRNNVSSLFSSVVNSTTSLGVGGTGHGVIDGSKVNLHVTPGPGPRKTINIPSYFGESVSSNQLDRLTKDASDEGPFGAKVAVGRTNYRIGDGLKIGYRVREECHYMVLHRSSQGEYTLLAPTPTDDATLMPNKAYKMDNIEITPPAGTEHVILICSKEPIDLERFQAGNADGLSISVVSYTIEAN